MRSIDRLWRLLPAFVGALIMGSGALLFAHGGEPIIACLLLAGGGLWTWVLIVSQGGDD